MADNSLPPDAKQRFYDQIDNWRGYNKQKIKVYLNLLNQLIESKGIENLRVLDLGCYDGRFGKLVLHETGLLIDGADISPDNLSKATSLRRKFHEDLDSPSWWKIDGTYDLIFAGDIIEHLINTDEFLININRLLKPNGLVVVSTPNVASLGRRLLLLFGKSPFLEISKIQEVNLHYAPIVGHIRYLQEAKKQGEYLIIGLNSDKSVKKIKGHKRPIIPEQERAEVLSALQSVDFVILFDEETPYELICRVQPDVLVKGGDWKSDDIVGKDIVEARGGKVLSLSYIEGRSTTDIIDKILQFS